MTNNKKNPARCKKCYHWKAYLSWLLIIIMTSWERASLTIIPKVSLLVVCWISGIDSTNIKLCGCWFAAVTCMWQFWYECIGIFHQQGVSFCKPVVIKVSTHQHEYVQYCKLLLTSHLVLYLLSGYKVCMSLYYLHSTAIVSF